MCTYFGQIKSRYIKMLYIFSINVNEGGNEWEKQ